MNFKKVNTLLFIFLYSCGVFGSGWPVTDVGSYTYYIEQLKEAQKQFENMKEQLDEATKLNTSFDGYMEDLRRQFDFVTNIKNDLQAKFDEFEQYGRSLSDEAREAFDFDRKYDLTDLRDVIDFNLDGIYVDPTDPNFDSEQITRLRNLERQRLLKEGLIKTEKSLVDVRNRYNRINQLTDLAKNSNSPKETADIANAILIEILSVNNEILEVLSTLGQAEMAAEFISYSKAEHEKALAADKLAKKQGYWRDGINFGTREEFTKILRECNLYEKEHGHSDITIEGLDCPDKKMRIRAENNEKEREASGQRKELEELGIL